MALQLTHTIWRILVLFLLGSLLATPGMSIDPGGLAGPQADKAAIGRLKTLHTVFVEGQQVVHTSTQNGTWSPTDRLSTTSSTATAPAIVANSADDRAVVFVSNPNNADAGELLYTFWDDSIGNWSMPVKIFDSLTASEPSIALYRGTVHLTWLDHSVYYASFPLSSPPTTPLPTTGTEIVASPILGSEVFAQPSIAVARRDRCGHQPPIIRVGYFWIEDPTPAQRSITARLADRSLSGNAWNVIYSRLESGDTVATRWFSSSLDANQRTGEFYFSYSFAAGNSTFNVMVDDLTRVDRAGVADVYNGGDPLAVKRVTASQSTCNPGAREAWSEFRPPSFYTQILVDTATWPSGAAAPTWAGATGLPGDGRDPQPVYWSRCVSGSFHQMSKIYELEIPQSVTTDYTISSGGCPLWLPCIAQELICHETMINVSSYLQLAAGGFGLPGEIGEVALGVTNDGIEPFEELISLDVELPAAVELVGVEGEEWSCEPGEGRLACFSRREVLEPGTASELILALKSTGESPGKGCGGETPCDQLCVQAEPEDDNPEDNRACLLLGSVK